MKDKILDITPGMEEDVDSWFLEKLETQINNGLYPNEGELAAIKQSIVDDLSAYSNKHRIEDVVVGMSGGVDSALTAALFKEAGWTVHGVVMPIHQNQEETDRGLENVEALGLELHNYDLSEQFDSMQQFIFSKDELESNTYRVQQRQGNIRARLRMITLYNLAHKEMGMVGSTDNFSELAAGFWTLHGDVGDVAPIQSLNKSWEVPMLAKMLGVPQATVEAVPTDGLGISKSDADQLGMSYLEFDIALFELLSLPRLDKNTIELYINSITDLKVNKKLTLVANRVASTTFKRFNPYNLNHPIFGNRFKLLETLDRSL